MKRSSRAPWLAVALGFVLPGLGHACSRQFGRGFVFTVFGWGAVWMTVFLAVGPVGAPFNLVLATPWVPVFCLHMSRDAFRVARLAPPGAESGKPWWLVCLAAVGLLLPWIALTEASAYYTPSMRTTTIPGHAMSPTFMDGDRVFLNLSAYGDRMPEPGDIVFFENPTARKRLLVKRCIAIGGQMVAIENGVVHVDGVRFEEPEGVVLMRENFGPEVVPAGHFFVLGDNRLRSADSRRWGAVPLDHLRGKAARELSWSEAAAVATAFLST